MGYEAKRGLALAVRVRRRGRGGTGGRVVV
jgi:hypothetical protein